MEFSNADTLDLALPGQIGPLNRIPSALALALLYYDFILTIPLEVERYWRRPHSYASLFFFVNRYLSVLSHIPIIYELFFMMPEPRCRKIQLYHNIIICLTQGCVAILMMLRIYALYLRDRRILYLLTTILAIGGGIDLWAVINHLPAAGTLAYPLHDSSIYSECDLTLTNRGGTNSAIAWSTILVFDAVGFILTLIQVVRIGGVKGQSMLYLMLRDGTIYFGILTIFNLSNILTLAFAQTLYKSTLTTLTNVLSTVLITRMMLNIRDPKLYGLSDYYQSAKLDSTLHTSYPQDVC